MGANADARSARTGTENTESMWSESKKSHMMTDPRPTPSQPLLVLIAEDEEPIAEAIALIVEDAGHTPLVAAHGQQALDLARTRKPALIITDLMMPLLDGSELIATIRADAQQDGHLPPPIILMTAAGMKRAYSAGADAVLRKPFELTDLENLLHRFLDSPPQDERE